MDFAEDLLEDEDRLYSAIDRILFLSCRRCMCYSPFMFYMPPGGCPLESTGDHIFCADCVLVDLLPAEDKSLIANREFLHLVKEFKYSNPYFRRYALIYRVLITSDTKLDIDWDQYKNLSLYEKLLKVQELFPVIHLMQNKRYSGLSEISHTIAARSEKIAHFYMLKNQQKPLQDDVRRTASDVEKITHPELGAVSSVSSLSSPSVPVLKQTARLRIVNTQDEDITCDICLLAIENNTIQFGPFVEKQFARDIFRCHYLCLLSGTHIAQRGIDTSGILGFLINDVKQSFQIYRNKTCYWCKLLSAPIKCNAPDCDRYFHYVCGYRNGCLTQFTGEYLSYCHEHLPLEESLQPKPGTECWICWDLLQPSNRMACVPTLCEPEESSPSQALELSWFHRECLQKYAYEAGYYFKCPICHDKQAFPLHAKMHGIFVPMRDASWEIDRTYFKDLHGCRCSAENCKYENQKLCPDRMIGCKACGGETLHLACAEISDPNDYVCSSCMDATFIKLF